MAQFIQFFSNIVLLSSIYILISLGFYLIHSVLGLINLANGEMILAGAYLSWMVNRWLGSNPYLSSLIVVPLMVFLSYIILYTPIYRLLFRNSVASIVVTWTLAIFLRHVYQQLFSNNLLTVQTQIDLSWQLAGLALPLTRIVITVCILAGVLGLYLFLQMSRLGKSIRCIRQNPEAAQMIGLDIPRLQAFVLTLAMVLTGLAGVLVSPIYTLTPSLGQWFTIKSLALVLLSSKGGLWLLCLSGLGLAFLENIVATYITGIGTNLSELIAPLVILLALFAQWWQKKET